jgi:hypothetical protein
MIVIQMICASAMLLGPNEDTPGLSWTGPMHLLDLLCIWWYQLLGLILFASVVGVLLGLAMRGENSAPRSWESTRFSFVSPEKPTEEDSGFLRLDKVPQPVRGLAERRFHRDIIGDSDAESN